MTLKALDRQHMRRALALARQGEGMVEPNPQVGCVIAKEKTILAEGYHRRFGAAHAEIDAIRQLPPDTDVRDATLYVTLEPCCHTGKTPPCSDAIVQTAIQRVVVAVEDPNPKVAGGGIKQLRDAGIQVEVGVEAEAGRHLLAPYLHLQQTGRPWIIAKWAMTLDGKIASATGSSQWISNTASREVVHGLRGRVDGILVGSRTANIDDPQLTARPPGCRTAARIIFDSQATLCGSPSNKLIKTVAQAPVIIAASEAAMVENNSELEEDGIEILSLTGASHAARLKELLLELGRRQMTNILVEGGAGLFGGLLDGKFINEVHVFIAPKLIGGANAPSAIHGQGIKAMQDALQLACPQVEMMEQDIYLHGRIAI